MRPKIRIKHSIIIRSIFVMLAVILAPLIQPSTVLATTVTSQTTADTTDINSVGDDIPQRRVQIVSLPTFKLQSVAFTLRGGGPNSTSILQARFVAAVPDGGITGGFAADYNTIYATSDPVTVTLPEPKQEVVFSFPNNEVLSAGTYALSIEWVSGFNDQIIFGSGADVVSGKCLRYDNTGTYHSQCSIDDLFYIISDTASSLVVVPTRGAVPPNGDFIWSPPLPQCNFDRQDGCHAGLDIAKDSTAPVYAMRSGVVIIAECNTGGYGWRVVIDHGDIGDGNHLFSHYAHMGLGDGKKTKNDCPGESYLLVSAGQSVTTGQQIGRQGNSGYAYSGSDGDGVHLHFAISVNPTYQGIQGVIDPKLCIGSVIPPQEYTAGDSVNLQTCPAT